jgi:hypothetical protein
VSGPGGSATTPISRCCCCTGGPGASDELYECFDLWFPQAGIEYYYYDQLGSFRSDQPDDPSLWTLERFVDEVVTLDWARRWPCEEVWKARKPG